MQSTKNSPLAITTNGAYGAGDVVGGLLQFPMTGQQGDNGILQDLLLVDAAENDAELYVIFFNENPSASTLTNNAAPTIHASDLAKIAAIVHVEAADWISIGGCAVASLNVSKGVKCSGSANVAAPQEPVLYAAIVCVATPNYTDGDLKAKISVMMD